MTKEELVAAMEAIGWGPIRLAAKGGLRLRQVSAWLNGTERCPQDMSEWITWLAEVHRANQSPRADRFVPKTIGRKQRRLRVPPEPRGPVPVRVEPAVAAAEERPKFRAPLRRATTPPATGLVPPPSLPPINPRDDVEACIRRLQEAAAQRIADRERRRW